MATEKKTGWTQHLATFLIIFVLGGLIMYRAQSCRSPVRPEIRPKNTRTVELKIDRWHVQAEIADTPALRRKGLMNRPVLEAGYGMLFVYREPTLVSFWMKDTTIPLSIAFISEDGTITQIEKLKPLDQTSVLSREPVKYALETRQGWFEDHAVKPGVRVEIPAELPPPPPQSAVEPSE